MRLKAIITLILLLIPGLSYAFPAIDFPELKHAFGTVGQEGKIEHFFEFLNGGDQDLIIEKVTAS